MKHPISVVIADDSAVMRSLIRQVIDADPHMRVVAEATNGEEACRAVSEHEPDVVTMDVEMPVMNGLEALERIMAVKPVPVVMLSSLTQADAPVTIEALELGAVDYLGKPNGSPSKIRMQAARIRQVVRGAASARVFKRRRRGNAGHSLEHDSTEARAARDGARPSARPASAAPSSARSVAGGGDSARPTASASGGDAPVADRLVLIGMSTGGPRTIMDVLPQLPADLNAAVVLVQHMPRHFTGAFAARMNAQAALHVREASGGEVLRIGEAWLAPGSRHLTFARRPSGVTLQVGDEPAGTVHTPSVDISMFSALKVFRNRLTGVVLTGMGADGAEAMPKVRDMGGKTIAEDESTCVVFGMPQQVIRAGGADQVLPAPRIAEAIVDIVGTRATRESTRRAG